MKKILHICAGWDKWNGAANIARMIMGEQRREGHEVSSDTWAGVGRLRAADEVWIHCGWLPCLWWAALWGRNVHWMPEACYDPVRLKYHGWKKWLAGPIERFCLRRAKALVATCEAEREWIEAYLGGRCPPVEVTDVKRFFDFSHVEQVGSCREGEWVNHVEQVGACREGERVNHVEQVGTCREEERGGRVDGELHVLYLGRRHPLKGVEYLEAAVRQIKETSASLRLCARIISNAFGEELEKVWEWCDVLVLPTLSENFGLVVAEALERGKRVITTDGAPAWDAESLNDELVDCGRLIYLKGYRDGTDEERVGLLKDAIECVAKK